MKLHLSLRRVNLALTVLLILVMGNQLGFTLAIGKLAVPITLADVVLGLAFIGIVIGLLSRGTRGAKLPPLQACFLFAVILVVFARTQDKAAAVKEVLQFAEYFLVAFAVFLNAADTADLKLLLYAFVAGTAIVIGWAAVQYFTVASPLDVRAGFANRNVLGAYLALALPFLYGLALHARYGSARIGLLVLVALGLLVNLSGGALLATFLMLLVLSAVRGQRALVPFLAATLAVVLLAPTFLPRRHHTDVLFSSIALSVDDNYLLSDRELVARARELLHPTHEIVLDHSGERAMPAPRPLDADRLLRLLLERRRLSRDENALFAEVQAAIQADTTPEQRANYPLKGPRLAVRYQRWDAALACIRSLWRPRGDLRGDPFLGYGLRPYHQVVNPFMTGRLQYRTDEPEVFNIATTEPFTHNTWLQAPVQMGLVGFLAVLWLFATFFGRADSLYIVARSELMLGLALGATGGILGFALAGLFTESLGRGLAIPFVFICSAVVLAERIVRGDGKSALEKLGKYD